MKTRKAWWAPEVVQTSNLDCGPATLKSLLAGHGIDVSYRFLREACQTGLDGTCIDTMEVIANRMGLAAEQITVPVDHVFIPESRTLPAIAIVRLPSGLTHFVVIWNRVGPYCQVMDPATGRRWVHQDALTRELYCHRMAVPAEGWREWAGSDDFLNVLRVRLSRLAIPPSEIRSLIAAGMGDATWQSLAALDAATRFMQSLSKQCVLPDQVARLVMLREFCRKPDIIPHQYWTVAPAQADEDGGAQLLVSGAILVRALGHTDATSAESAAPEERPERDTPPMYLALRLLRESGWAGVAVAVGGVIGAACLTVFEAILFRSLFDAFSRLHLPEQHLGAFAALGIFALASLALEWATFRSVTRLGRQLETRLRLAFLSKLPKLSDRYLQSRLTSDLADRAHATFRLKQFPTALVQFVSLLVRLALTTAAVIWLVPKAWALLALMLAATLIPPLAGISALRERDLKTRTHAGALMRFYLDAMLGLMPVRAHRAARNLKAEQEQLLGEWAVSALSLQRAAVLIEGIQTLLVLAPIIALLLTQPFASDAAGRLLLTIYWTLNIPILGRDLAAQIRRYPYYRNLLARLIEPLDAAEDPHSEAAPLTAPPRIEFRSVSASIAGNAILQDIDLVIEPGEQVAVVGTSGAGKSSLVSLLLGWLTPTSGEVLINGQALDVNQLRRTAAWVDPAVQIWNDSLFSNIAYGSDGTTGAVADAVERALLRPVLEHLPSGMQTQLGEGGALVSGGEGQRVRFARATVRQDAPLVILDEPFRGLDRTKRQELLARARQLWSRATLLCVTHDIHQTRTFDRVIVVEAGRIVDCGKPATLLASSTSRYAQLLTAERNAYAGLWSARFWRRIWVENGRAVETLPDRVPETEAEVA